LDIKNIDLEDNEDDYSKNPKGLWQRFKLLFPVKDPEEFDSRVSYLDWEKTDDWKKRDPWPYFIYWRILGLIPPYGRSSFSTILGMSLYGKKGKWFIPFRWWGINVMFLIDDLYYAVKHRFFTKLWLLQLDINRYKWMDSCDLLFHANFAVLKHFVEYELGQSDKPNNYRGYRLHSNEESIIDLYLWYRDEFPQEKKDFSNNNKYPSNWLDDRIDKKLQELVDLRRSLWT